MTDELSLREIPSKGPILIVGLGNPGREYRRTRHNVGFMVVEALAEHLNCQFSNLKFSSMIAKCSLEGRVVYLQKPLTFMNLSGQAVKPLVKYIQLPLTNLMVVHDDIDIQLGRLKFKWDGGTAGHKGVTSVVNSLGSKDFSRLRIGILNADKRYINVKDYVLESFEPSEEELLREIIEMAVEGLMTYCTWGLREAMNRFNSVRL